MRAEWTKFRTVRGWVIGLVLAAVVDRPARFHRAGRCRAVRRRDRLSFPSARAVRRWWTTSPSCTAAGRRRQHHRPGDLADRPDPGLDAPAGEDRRPPEPGRDLVPWAKAGVIIKDSDTQGSAYAAIMVTGEHGVRMQDNFTHDIAGRRGLG